MHDGCHGCHCQMRQIHEKCQVRRAAKARRPAGLGVTLGVHPTHVSFWDPLEISADGDVALFKSRRRAASVVHGRMCMVACAYELGCQHFSQNFAVWADMPQVLQGCVAEFLAVCELFSRKLGWRQRVHVDPCRECAAKSDLLAGRLALVAVSSLCCQDALTDSFICLDVA